MSLVWLDRKVYHTNFSLKLIIYMKNSVHPIKLVGDYCALTPLSLEHHYELSEAAADGELSKLWYTFVPEPQSVKENIELRLELQQTGSMLPFAVIDNQTQKAIGMTTYLNIEREHRRVEIGGTWYRKS